MNYSKLQKPDYTLAFLFFILTVFGLIMVSSASAVISYERFGRNDIYLLRQLLSFGIGLIAWVFFQSIDYRKYRKIASVLLIITIILLILVFIPGIGHSWREVYRWIDLRYFAFQPSEIVKLTLILYLAAWFEKKKSEIKDFKKGFLPFILLLILLTVLIIKQPDLGTLTVLVGTAVTIYFLAGAPLAHLTVGLAAAFLTLLGLIKYAPYRMARLIAYLDPEKDPLGTAYHIRNALIAIGSGGLFGLGFGQSRQKHLFLPEAYTDSIFAIICEELGFIVASLVILAFICLAYRGYKIAQSAPDQFGRLLAGGITTWFVFQAFINIAGISGLSPFTGVPLPFISYGGTSLVVSLAGAGILLNISKYSR